MQLTLQICPRTLQEYTASLHSVPCAYFKVSLRECTIPSSRWVHFAGFSLVGFRFFCSIGEDVVSFCQGEYRSCTVILGVCVARFRGVRSELLFAPYGHHVPS
jgi:hypothetical protein